MCSSVHNFISPLIGQCLPKLSYHPQLLYIPCVDCTKSHHQTSTYIWATSHIYLTLLHMSLAKLSYTSLAFYMIYWNF